MSGVSGSLLVDGTRLFGAGARWKEFKEEEAVMAAVESINKPQLRWCRIVSPGDAAATVRRIRSTALRFEETRACIVHSDQSSIAAKRVAPSSSTTASVVDDGGGGGWKVEDSCTVAHNLQPIAEATGTRIAGLSPRHVRATRRVCAGASHSCLLPSCSKL